MTTLERKIAASEDGKILFVKVNGKILSVPWCQSYFHMDEKVRVEVEEDEDETVYVILPQDTRLTRRETHWIENRQEKLGKEEGPEVEVAETVENHGGTRWNTKFGSLTRRLSSINTWIFPSRKPAQPPL